MGFIYVAQCGEYYKVGYTRQDVAKRISALQTGNAEQIRLVGVVTGTIFDEARWHDFFSAKRKRGEWFSLTEDDVKCILEPESPADKLANMLAKGTPEMRSHFVKEFNKIMGKVQHA